VKSFNQLLLRRAIQHHLIRPFKFTQPIQHVYSSRILGSAISIAYSDEQYVTFGARTLFAFRCRPTYLFNRQSMRLRKMRVSREQAAENRKRVVEVAGKLFRENGFEGISVAEIMKAAGLTHGGFYGQFASKDALAAEALSASLNGSAKRWRARAAAHPDTSLAALIESYLSADHGPASTHSCAIATLASDAPRQPDAVRAAYDTGVQELVAILAEAIPNSAPAERQQQALVTFATMVGAVALARATPDANFAKAVLDACRAELTR
jgi:TetR/AcrR family transcriptional repressor of nem operon